MENLVLVKLHTGKRNSHQKYDSHLNKTKIMQLKAHNTQHRLVVMWVKKFQSEKTIGIQLVRPTEDCGKP